MDADTINSVFPICSMEVYPSGTVVVKRECLLQSTRPKRKGVRELSGGSLFRLLFIVKESTIPFCSLLTFTYPHPFSFTGKEVKKHLNTILTWMRRKAEISYIWFLEFQRRGAPHFHVLLSILPYTAIREELAHRWSKLVGKDAEERYKVYKVHKHPRTWEEIRHIGGAERYIAKYAAKQNQKKVPDWYKGVGRFWAASRDVKQSIPQPIEIDVGEDELRGILHTDRHPATSWDVLPKFIFSRNGIDNYI